MTGWDKEVIRQFELFQEGLDTAIEHDVDAFNRRSVQERSHLNWEDTIDELKRAHEAFNRVARLIASHDLSEHSEYRDWVEVQVDHYAHHTRQLEKWV